MKTLENVTRFRCEHCDKEYKQAHHCARHELFCGRNPRNQYKCTDCKYMKETEYCIDSEYGGTGKSFRCDLLNMGLYTHMAEKKKLLEKYPDDFEGHERMRTECLHYEQRDSNSFMGDGLFF